LFALARALAEAWPNDAPRDALIAHAFEVSRPNESHRARLRVEVGRLRRALRAIASLEATPRGFIMKPRRAREVVVLARPLDDAHGRVLALLSDGEAWSSSSLAMALGVSQRTLQRELMALEQDGKIVSFGRARAQRWHAPPIGGFTPVLLLPPPLPID
jgi:DNA-binding transcriptional ArsR family regulator